MYSILLCISMQLPLINNHFKEYSEVSNVNYEQFLLHLPDVSHSLRSIFYLCINSLYLRCSFCSVWFGNWNLPLWMPGSNLSFPDTNGHWRVLICMTVSLYHHNQFNPTQTLFCLFEDNIYSKFKVPKDKRMNFLLINFILSLFLFYEIRGTHMTIIFSLFIFYNYNHGTYILSIYQ